MKRVWWTLAVLLLALLLLVTLLLQGQPLVPHPTDMPMAERVQQARESLRRNDPRGLPPGPRQLRLAETELEWLLDLGLGRWRPATSEVRLQPGTAEVALSVELPLPGPWHWLNIQSRWRQAPPSGVWPALEELRIGRLPLPGALSGWLLHQAVRQAVGEQDLQLSRSMLRHMSFGPQQVDLRYEWRADSLQALAGRVWPAAEQQRLRAYQERLVGLSAQGAAGSPVSLAAWLPELLQLAAQRSAGREAVAAQENRALILTLGLYGAGHSWGRFIPTAKDWPQPAPRVLTLAGRDDFALHLLISAVIAIEGGGPVADAIGLYKEVADTRGGSGFSFNDLAADLAGKRLGLLAQQSPLRLQQLGAGPVREADFMPEVADLPEFLSAERLQQEYGGPAGPGYQAMMARIEARVAALAWFR